MLSIILTIILLSVSITLLYAVIKIPSVKTGGCKSKPGKCVDLEFYFKEFDGKPNLFLKIVNKSIAPITNINGVAHITSREGVKPLQPFTIPDINSREEFSVYLTSLSRMVRYYVEVTLKYRQLIEDHSTKIISEIYLP
ncbi:MAG: hypothetical protein OdinLCB4_004975 [Candidatus Odinarchaeum yellowstonii]|uniref:Uncharacterized protein n=1 Tax=Odinarchaeota yellowstonii (strain LCB_4) TaxID=1841599 RepID=A0AAF0D1A5_ODILC|nr:MAG: hypothetical protein OdinLCB4_004975 [Candidatus Odinarchaeum yellowstonii]